MNLEEVEVLSVGLELMNPQGTQEGVPPHTPATTLKVWDLLMPSKDELCYLCLCFPEEGPSDNCLLLNSW